MGQGGTSKPCCHWLHVNPWLPQSSCFLEIQGQASGHLLSWRPEFLGKKVHTQAGEGEH